MQIIFAPLYSQIILLPWLTIVEIVSQNIYLDDATIIYAFLHNSPYNKIGCWWEKNGSVKNVWRPTFHFCLWIAFILAFFLKLSHKQKTIVNETKYFSKTFYEKNPPSRFLLSDNYLSTLINPSNFLICGRHVMWKPTMSILWSFEIWDVFLSAGVCATRI